MLSPNKHIKYFQYQSGDSVEIESEVIVEMPVSITVNGELWLTFMCTPIHLEELAVGFLFNEGLVHQKDEISDVRLCQSGDNVDIWLNRSIQKPTQWRRTSGCTGGITSVAENSLEMISSVHTSIVKNSFLTAERVSGLISALFETQDIYRRSGGVHTSALSDGEVIIVSAEDIGRHNTLDKIAGICLLQDIWPENRIIMTTGRISSEMLQKAFRLGASILISRTSPSSLSIQLAEQYGITLIGYARRNRFNLYSHPKRIISELSETNVSQDLFPQFEDSSLRDCL